MIGRSPFGAGGAAVAVTGLDFAMCRCALTTGDGKQCTGESQHAGSCLRRLLSFERVWTRAVWVKLAR